MVDRPERRPVQIGDKTQFTLEETLLSTILTYVDQADFGQWARKERFNPRARDRIERVERAIHHEPLWPL